MAVELKDFYKEGLADDKYTAGPNAFVDAKGCNIHSKPGQVSIQQALVDEGLSLSSNEPIAMAVYSDDNTYIFLDDGEIWKRTSTGTYSIYESNVFTNWSISGSVILDAIEFNDKLYFTTELSVVEFDPTVGSGSKVVNSLNSNDDYHPMYVLESKLYIGNDNQLATIDTAAIFTANEVGINLPDGQVIQSIGAYQTKILVGTIGMASATGKMANSHVLLWDGISEGYNLDIPVEDFGVYSFIDFNNTLLASIGESGDLYIFTGAEFVPFKKFPGDYAAGGKVKVKQNAHRSYRGQTYLGLSNIELNPADQGVYSMGGYSGGYPDVLNFEFYVGDSRGVTNLDINFIEISAEGNLLVGSNLGMHRLRTTIQDDATFSTGIIPNEEAERANRVSIYYNTLDDEGDITLKYSINGGTTQYTATLLHDADRKILYTKTYLQKCRSLQLHVTMEENFLPNPVLEKIVIT